MYYKKSNDSADTKRERKKNDRVSKDLCIQGFSLVDVCVSMASRPCSVVRLYQPKCLSILIVSHLAYPHIHQTGILAPRKGELWPRAIQKQNRQKIWKPPHSFSTAWASFLSLLTASTCLSLYFPDTLRGSSLSSKCHKILWYFSISQRKTKKLSPPARRKVFSRNTLYSKKYYSKTFIKKAQNPLASLTDPFALASESN